jgi:hypothetical protein
MVVPLISPVEIPLVEPGITMPVTRIGEREPPVMKIVKFISSKKVMLDGYLYRRLSGKIRRLRQYYVCTKADVLLCRAGLSLGQFKF